MGLRSGLLCCAVVSLTLAACAPAAPPLPPPADPSVADQVRRLAAILDYVAADYPGAVDDGAIVNPLEYDEQRAFLADAVALARILPAAGDAPTNWKNEISGVRELVERRQPAAEVAARAREARRELLAAHGVVIAPTVTPSLSVGRELYAGNCAVCHGTTGLGDGERSPALVPPPRSFHEIDVMSDLTPARAYSALTDGVEGTAMPSFALLPSADRWSLAFYVFTLRHDSGAAVRGRSVYIESGRVVPSTLTALAGTSDGELERALAAAGLEGSRRDDALAFLRTAAPFQTEGAPFDLVRRRLDIALSAYRAGDSAAAKRETSGAYLDGFEPHEAALRTREAALVWRVEEAFLGLRQAIDERARPAELEQRALRVIALLDAAEERLTGARGAEIAFVGAFAILIREGLEAALIVLLILDWARRSGASPLELRAVHRGWLAALGLGAMTWLASGSILARFGGARRELIEGIVALLAAVVLLAASHFVLARLDARRRIQALKRRLDAASLPRRRLVLTSLAFVAVYRESFEVVLFLRALLLDSGGSAAPVAAGTLLAVLLLVLMVILLGRMGRRLRPAAWLTASGTLLCLLAVILAGKGVRSLQEAGYMSIEMLALPRLDGLGLYPTLETVLAQVAVLLAFAVIAIGPALRARVGASAAGGSSPG